MLSSKDLQQAQSAEFGREIQCKRISGLTCQRHKESNTLMDIDVIFLHSIFLPKIWHSKRLWQKNGGQKNERGKPGSGAQTSNLASFRFLMHQAIRSPNLKFARPTPMWRLSYFLRLNKFRSCNSQ
jgi:hypothetical protein